MTAGPLTKMGSTMWAPGMRWATAPPAGSARQCREVADVSWAAVGRGRAAPVISVGTLAESRGAGGQKTSSPEEPAAACGRVPLVLCRSDRGAFPSLWDERSQQRAARANAPMQECSEARQGANVISQCAPEAMPAPQQGNLRADGGLTSRSAERRRRLLGGCTSP